MKQTYYLFNPGRMSRKDNTLKFVATDEHGVASPAKYLPIERISSLYIFGSIDANSSMYNFLGKQQIPVHFFDYYEHYTGSFQPKEYLLAGKMQIEQSKTYLKKERRLHLARNFVNGGGENILKNLKYYNNRDCELSIHITKVTEYLGDLPAQNEVSAIMGLEGNCRNIYYDAFEDIIQYFEMGNREKRPPSNEVNALISFGNMLCYTLCLDQIYHTQLNPTISFLHEPGTRRYSLALDIAEIFKPILVDRLIFRMLNRKEIQAKHFQKELNACYLNTAGKKIFIKAWETKLAETIQHRVLKKKVSYKHLVKLECYKIAKYILKIEQDYKPFKIWW